LNRGRPDAFLAVGGVAAFDDEVEPADRGARSKPPVIGKAALISYLTEREESVM
jgi:hypothetical protein